MNYLGYRIKVNDFVVPENLISKGTYNCEPNMRLANSWTDANGKDNFEYFPNPKYKITFAIRERNVLEQETLVPLFLLKEDINVEYWDDITCTYKTGIFHMNRPKFIHRDITEALGILYGATTLVLEEY